MENQHSSFGGLPGGSPSPISGSIWLVSTLWRSPLFQSCATSTCTKNVQIMAPSVGDKPVLVCAQATLSQSSPIENSLHCKIGSLMLIKALSDNLMGRHLSFNGCSCLALDIPDIPHVCHILFIMQTITYNIVACDRMSWYVANYICMVLLEIQSYIWPEMSCTSYAICTCYYEILIFSIKHGNFDQFVDQLIAVVRLPLLRKSPCMFIIVQGCSHQMWSGQVTIVRA